MTITNFKIEKLWGIKTYNINIEDNKLIIVSENGEGKTIVLRLIYYFLSKQWDKLSEYDFQSISAIINNKKYHVNKHDFTTNITSIHLKKISEKYPIYKDFVFSNNDFKNKGLRELLKKNTINELKNPIKINIYAEQNSIPDTIFEDIINIISELKFKEIDFEYKIPVLFLPTYRRIEQDFDKIFKDFNYTEKIDNTKNNNENDEFDFIKTWNEIISERWSKDDETLELVEFGLNDIEFKLDKAVKSKKIKKVTAFIEKCNSFFINKELTLNNSIINVKLSNSDKKFELNTENIFSSGEKQIISIFFYLYLNEQNYFVIFDEPELSISIRWQERLLEELSNSCSGYIVATHSHSIVTEEQEKYLFSIDNLLE